MSFKILTQSKNNMAEIKNGSFSCCPRDVIQIHDATPTLSAYWLIPFLGHQYPHAHLLNQLISKTSCSDNSNIERVYSPLLKLLDIPSSWLHIYKSMLTTYRSMNVITSKTLTWSNKQQNNQCSAVYWWNTLHNMIIWRLAWEKEILSVTMDVYICKSILSQYNVSILAGYIASYLLLINLLQIYR